MGYGLNFNRGFWLNCLNIALIVAILSTMVIWVLRFIESFSRREKPVGIPITKTDLLHLQQLVMSVADDLNVQQPDDIEILHLPNAYASELLSKNGTIRKVYIGWSFITMLTEVELKAIIAHELAHFDNDAFFLNRAFWNIETATSWWLQYANDKSTDPGNNLTIARILIQVYVLIFSLLFNLITKPFRYGFEYYCDKKAARYYGANQTGSALQKALAMQITFVDYLRQISKNNLQFSYQQYFYHHQQLVGQTAFTNFFNELSRKNDNSHPSLVKRLRNISRIPHKSNTSSKTIFLSDIEISHFEEKLNYLFKD